MSDTAQNYGNHGRIVPGYHYFTFALVVAVLVWSVKRAMSAPGLDTAMGVVLILALLFSSLYGRTFALKVQDRVIRLEEQMRMARLLPADLQARIGEFSVNQLVALRFASDKELPELAARVLRENITDRKEIKKLVKEWRADNARA